MAELNQTQPLAQLAQTLGLALQAQGWQLALAESCTGGMVAETVTAIAGSSAWFDCGFVTYSNAAKSDLLAVPATLIAAQGAVSEPVAQAMALGALNHSRAQLAGAITGIAGPDGGSESKPVGTVCFAWAYQSHRDEPAYSQQTTQHFHGDRQAVRTQATVFLLTQLLACTQAG